VKATKVLVFLFLCGCSHSPPLRAPSSIALDWPFEQFKVTQEFGKAAEKGRYASNRHWGIDISQGDGAEIRPIADGVIIAIGSEDCANQPDMDCNFGFGNWVLVDHPQLGVQSFYGHLARQSSLTEGQKVDRETLLGKEGRSGQVFQIGSNKKLAESDCETHLHLSIGELHAYRNKNFDNQFDLSIGELKNPREVLPVIGPYGRFRF
jgi:murein DD-endopeptidase MepM/ murein hydrolase activator NlpD